MAQTCKHEDCFCEVPQERSDEHCSDYCLRHDSGEKHERHVCACEHGGCRPAGDADG
jgi:hypothetical protein